MDATASAVAGAPAGASPAVPERELDVLLTRLREQAAAVAPELLDLVDELETRLEDTDGTARELERERARLRQVLGRFPGGLVALDRELRVAYASPGARELLAPQPLETGLPLPDPWPSLSLRAYAAALFAPDPSPRERRVELEDGGVVAVEGIPAQHGEALLLLSDATADLRRIETERAFIRNAAHELRTPLTAISTAVEVLQAGAKTIPADRDHFLGHIERQCSRLARLTHALLVLARAQGGHEPPRLELVPLTPLLADVAEVLRPADGAGIEVECAGDLNALADRDVLEHAVYNLVANAVRHARSDAVRLLARATSDRHVEIEVSDDGEGISPEHRERLTEPFYRGDARDGDGFGLGLSIASQAVAALGGTLEIESEPSLGTRVLVRLPSREA